MIRLHFQEFDSKIDFSDAQFHVLANGLLLLHNFSIGTFSQTPRVHDYMVWIDNDELVITFTPSKKSKFAFINAIEVVSAPKDLVSDVATLVSNSNKIEKIDGLIKYALETVYRVNVGGPKVTPFNDSLWRTWVPDDEFLKSSYGSKTVHFGGRIKYHMGGASREVGPDNVYNSARVIRSSKDLIPKANISWEFPVTEGYKYLLRLHFCDIASASLGMIYFNVYINGNLAYENVDLSETTNWVLASPVYADFVVDGRKGLDVLSVSVGPSNSSMVNGVDGILNGVEIMKMNNSMGSLDGEICAGSISMGWQRGGGSSIGAMIPLVAVLCLLVIASLMMHKQWDRIKDSVAWTPLPIAEVDLKSGGWLSLRK